MTFSGPSTQSPLLWRIISLCSETALSVNLWTGIPSLETRLTLGQLQVNAGLLTAHIYQQAVQLCLSALPV